MYICAALRLRQMSSPHIHSHGREVPPRYLHWMRTLLLQVSTLMPWLLGPRRWTRHREPLVFVLRFLRTAALQGQFNPKVTVSPACCLSLKCGLRPGFLLPLVLCDVSLHILRNGVSAAADGRQCQCAHSVQQTGAAEGPPARLLNVVLVSKCVQLAMFSLFFRVRPLLYLPAPCVLC
jgi:hypothetical protein